MTATIRVVVADDHPLMLDGIKDALEAHPSITVVGTAKSFNQVPSVLKEAGPNVLVLDLAGMGNAMIGLMQRLGRDFPKVGVVIFSSHLSYVAELAHSQSFWSCSAPGFCSGPCRASAWTSI